MGLERKAVPRAAPAHAVRYERRRPEETILHCLVREHLETFLAQVEARTGTGVPGFVKDEFEAFLECGVLAHGFLRVRCAECTHEKLVAFSCKRRGFCPSCGARRMAESAAYLVDQVIARVPVRQWVLSFSHSPANPVRGAARAAHAGAAHRAPRHRAVSAQAGRPEPRHSRHRRGHAHPAIRLGAPT